MSTNNSPIRTLAPYVILLTLVTAPGVMMRPCSAGVPRAGAVLSLALASVAADPTGSTAVVVDNFETYTNTSPNKIYETWIDGIGYAGHAGNGSGALVGHDILGRGTRYTTIVETALVHGGKQSMPLYYYNVKTPFYSEGERTFANPQDWATGGGNALSLWFRGQASNAADPLYVNVEDSAGKNKTAVHTDAQAAKSEQWQPWQIDLAVFNGAGVNLKSVKKLRLGVGDRSKTKAGGLGIVYFDDVAISRGAAAPSQPVGTKSQGSIVCWGSNVYGQCTNPPAGKDFVAIAAGAYYTLALRANGSIVGWGKDEHGQATPPAGNDFVAIAAGNYHSLALKADGSIVGWGGNDYGESTPPEGNNFIAIAAGDSYSLALRSDHSMAGWGYNNKGQATPMPGKNFIAIAAGRVQSAALRDSGTIVVWGTTGWAYTGGGLYVFFGRSPDTTDFIALGVGNTHGVGLRADGSVEAWGYINGLPPTTKGFTALAVGGEHDLALTADGTIFGWSRNDYGQAYPPAGSGFIAISAGREHSVAIKGE